MLKISKKGDYGLLLLTALTGEGRGRAVSLSKLAREKKMPYKYLSQIAPLLVGAGILDSREGSGGGYFLKREAKRISVWEVLELLEGPLAPVACMRQGCRCENDCGQREMLTQMAEGLKEQMRKMTIADLAKKGGKK